MANAARELFTQVLDRDVDAFYAKLGLSKDSPLEQANELTHTVQQLTQGVSIELPDDLDWSLAEPLNDAVDEGAGEAAHHEAEIAVGSDPDRNNSTSVILVTAALILVAAVLAYTFWPSQQISAHVSVPVAQNQDNQLALAKAREEAAQQQEQLKAAEAKKLDDERRIEAARLATEATKKAEEARKAEQARIAAAEAKKAEEVKKAEQLRLAAEAKKTDEARKAEQARLIAEVKKKAEEAKKAEQARLAAEAKKAEEARKAEQARLAAEAKKADEARKVAAIPSALVLPDLSGTSLSPVAMSSMDMMITHSDLLDFTDAFSLAFEIGDLRALRELFSDKVSKSDAARIKELENLFKEKGLSASERKLQLTNIQWDIGAGGASGNGSYRLSLVEAGKTVQSQGRLTVDLNSKEGRLLITRFDFQEK